MFEPRIPKPSYVSDGSMTFIGGTADFDLWIKNPPNEGYGQPPLLLPLRIHNMQNYWDIFPVPLLYSDHDLHARRRVGYFKDITLTIEQAEVIDNYIQCFAPWVLGYSLTKQGHGDG
jgi:hypothetical protein